jgi:probable F420-dependent oxidoreductase
MRFSVSLPHPGARAGTDTASQARYAAVVEECGFHAISATDHPFPVVGGESVSHHAYDPFTLLAFLAARTERIRLHFSILVAGYRNPFLAAHMLATLDEISSGRVIVAVGVGYNRAEFQALGARFGGRGRHSDEVISAMRSAWKGEPVQVEHPDWRAEGNTLFPAFAGRSHPPLWRGGNSAGARASAARSFDGWAPLEVAEKWAIKAGTTGLTLSTLPEAVAEYHQEWREAGRSGTPDVCLVRGRTDWLRDPARLVAETKQLEQMGVTWVEITPHGDTPEAVESSLRNTARWLVEANLLAAD